ncbi:GntR family transcriptional regulator [Microtetraspora sp. NBRC 16547]|uniref:GntR family transcriptional regulator n=1 Tax=Microtetraspora sp. NBRC 16547 TaxID=3030993 RepID=UPI0024A0A7B8|nr:GntR family transcriptional regulator [Microtetraspora sp. NBRC 16547]GLW99245.1 GntR family transcriptional regulator [Microtetraspora sp. NBRC 16547]
MIEVDVTSPSPPYEQIRAQFAKLIKCGVLAVGTRLPPVRQLAADLGLATGTVARAYKELEQAGYVTGKRGGGTRVLPQPEPRMARAELIRSQARAYLAEVIRLGGSAEEAIATLSEVVALSDTAAAAHPADPDLHV